MFCLVVQLSEQRGVPFTASLRVAAILHVSVLQLVGEGFAIAWIAHLRNQNKICIRFLHAKTFPFRAFPVFNQLTNFIVSAKMALLGSASPALLTSDTASPNDLRQGSGVNSITWCTFVTSRPCSRYHLRTCVACRILSPFMLPIKLRPGCAMMLCSSAYVFMKSPISSRLISVSWK